MAEIEGEIVGHILFSPMTVRTDTDTNVAICLGPMAIVPHYQRQGIGTRLVETALEELRSLVNTAVFLLGDVGYYERFGFRPAYEFDVHYRDDPQSFLALELSPGALTHVTGTAWLAPEFERTF